MSAPPPPHPQALAALRRFARPRAAVERCDLCGAILAPQHPHLLDLASQRVACGCDACAVLFSGSHHPRFRRIPQRVERLRDFRLADAQWDGLLIPINVAFFFHHSASGKVVARYPSPAGAAESLLPLETWAELVRDNPVLAELEPDVEALLVNRLGSTRDHYRVPIDVCYQLVGILRSHWRGLSGGAEVWEQVGRFFDGLNDRASPV